MLIIQGKKTQCALHRGEGTKGLEIWSVSIEPRENLSLFPREVTVQSLQPNCVAQDSQVWHLGHLHVQTRQHDIDHLASAPGRTGRDGVSSRPVVKFLTIIPFHIIMCKLFTSLRRSQRKGGLRQSGLPAFASEPCCSVKMASTLQRSFFRKDSNEQHGLAHH